MLQKSTDNDKCDESDGISLTKCLKNYIAQKVGCALNWFQNSSYPSCSQMEDYVQYLETFNYLFGSPYSKILEETSCPKKCKYTNYKILRHQREEITWNTTRWLSEFYIYQIYDAIETRLASK